MTALVEQAAPVRPMKPPKRWKMWILTCVAIYPIITALGYVLAAVAETLPVWAHFLIMVPIAVALLIFFVMPALTKLFRPWLTR
jgi:antibiotic biosynthesis monooxygenase (ABM) superfamily enzyme